MGKYILLLLALVTGLVGGYGFVFGGNIVFSNEIRYISGNSDEVFLGNEDLDSLYVVFQSNINISGAEIVSVCNISYNFEENYRDMYIFELDYSAAPDCKNGNFVLNYDNQLVANASGQIRLVSSHGFKYDYLDYDNNYLRAMLADLAGDISDTRIYQNYTGKQKLQYFKYLRGQREYLESNYKAQVLREILVARGKKYSSPVLGYTISEQANKVPNAGRPYRASYTDGVHRGWDIDSPFRSDTVALDDGFIVRIVSGFDDSNFSQIVYGNNLGESQELKNLDILRGNQVWLKTMKGDVVFYSHLDEIDANIKEGDFVLRGQLLGKTGVSGVPETGYDDFHLHFSIMKNQYDRNLAGSYDFGDYMAWDWITKGLSHNDVVAAQKETFE